MVGAAAAAGAPRGTVCAAAVQDPHRSFIATAAATAPAFRPPGLGRPPPSSVRPSVRPSVQPSLAGSGVDVGRGRAQPRVCESRG